MTERQAWAALAKGVSDGTFDAGLCMALACDPRCHACKAIGTIPAPKDIKRRIMATIRVLPSVRGGAYKWPLTPKGQKARAAYCRRQVARLTPKPKAAPKRRKASK